MSDISSNLSRSEMEATSYWRMMADLKAAEASGDRWAICEAHYELACAEMFARNDDERRRYSYAVDHAAAALYEAEIAISELDERRVHNQVHACTSAANVRQRRAELQRLEEMSVDPTIHEIARRDAREFLAATG